MKRMRVKRSKDLAIFRRTAARTRRANIVGSNLPRGGVRL